MIATSPFQRPQILSTRARKDVKVGDIKVDVCVFAFDCLYLNGEPLLTKPLTERREALYGSLKEVEGQLAFATAKVSRDVEELEVRGFDCLESVLAGAGSNASTGPAALLLCMTR